VPNARRENFEVNHHYYNLLVQLGPVAGNISQHCRSASVSRNAEQAIQNAVIEVERRLKQKKALIRTALSSAHRRRHRLVGAKKRKTLPEPERGQGKS
jgi:molecular chaperone HtpG